MIHNYTWLTLIQKNIRSKYFKDEIIKINDYPYSQVINWYCVSVYQPFTYKMDSYECINTGKKRIKNKNWTTAETTLLIDMCISNIEIVNGEGDKSPFWDEAAKAYVLTNHNIRKTC